MGNKEQTIATFTVKIHREDNGDMVPLFVRPDLKPVDKVEYFKLALIAGELINLMKDQCIVVNTDVDGRIERMANLIVDDEGFNKAKEDFIKADADVDKYQLKLPFEEDQDGKADK